MTAEQHADEAVQAIDMAMSLCAAAKYAMSKGRESEWKGCVEDARDALNALDTGTPVRVGAGAHGGAG